MQNDSPFTAAKASLLLTLLQQECDEQLKISSDQTVLCRVLKQLPKIIDLIKVLLISPKIVKSENYRFLALPLQLLMHRINILQKQVLNLIQQVMNEICSHL